MSIHGHKVLEMMQGKSFTEESLISTIQQDFGVDAQFHTCSAQGMDAQALVAFLKDKGKFKPDTTAIEQNGFTVDETAVCDHDHTHE